MECPVKGDLEYIFQGLSENGNLWDITVFKIVKVSSIYVPFVTKYVTKEQKLFHIRNENGDPVVKTRHCRGHRFNSS